MEHPNGWVKFQFEFHLEEYKALKDEVLKIGAEVETLLRFVLVSDAAIATWVLSTTNNDIAVVHITKWLPFLLTITSGILAMTYSLRIYLARDYLSLIERDMAHAARGWEVYIASKTTRTQRANLMTGNLIALIWVLLILMTGMLGLYWQP